MTAESNTPSRFALYSRVRTMQTTLWSRYLCRRTRRRSRFSRQAMARVSTSQTSLPFSGELKSSRVIRNKYWLQWPISRKPRAKRRGRSHPLPWSSRCPCSLAVVSESAIWEYKKKVDTSLKNGFAISQRQVTTHTEYESTATLRISQQKRC